MNVATFEPGKNLVLTLFVLVIILVLGLLVGTDINIGLYMVSLFGVLIYLFLCIARPFWAFAILILLGLTVWISTVQLAEGVSLMVGAGGVFLAVWLVRILLQKINFVTIKEFWYLVGMAAVIGFSTLINWGGPAGFTPVFTYIQLLILTVLVINFVTSSTQLQQLGYVFIVSSVLMAVVILMNQRGILPNGLVKILQSGIYTSYSFDRFDRTGGIFGDPNFTALQLTIALPFIVEYWRENGVIGKVWLVVAGFAILLAFSYTVSVGGLIGIASMLLVKALLVRHRNFLLILVRTTLISMVVLWLAFHFLPSYYFERIEVNLAQFTQYFQTYDQRLLLQLGTSRGDTWQSAFKTFLQSPIIGHGPGNSLFLNPLNSVLRYSRPALAAHNFILSLANDLGLMGLFFFISLLVTAFWAVRPFGFKQTPSNSVHATGNAIFTALLACVVQGMALDLHTQKVLWILLGMGLAYYHTQRLNDEYENIDSN